MLAVVAESSVSVGAAAKSKAAGRKSRLGPQPPPQASQVLAAFRIIQVIGALPCLALPFDSKNGRQYDTFLY